MKTCIIAYLATAAVFLGLDYIWLAHISSGLYRSRIGGLLLEHPKLHIAAVFYLGYVVGVVYFAVLPALKDKSWVKAMGSGALLGLVAYGTYDMTNLSTLLHWNVTVSLIDMMWGTSLTAMAALAGYLITAAVAPRV